MAKSAKPFYESVFIIRQDVSSSEVDKITEDFVKFIKENNGTVVKTEYWELRNLAYKIGTNKKGHYVFVGYSADSSLLKQLEKKMKLSESVIRFFTTKVDSISLEPSPILKSQNLENESVVDVTINKD